MSHAASWTIAPGRTTGAASGFPALCVLLCIALSPPALAAQELLGPAVRFSTGAYTRALAVADIDGDGAPDLVTAGGADAAPTVMHNDGDGAFLRTHSYRLGGPIADRVPTEVVESVVPPFLRRVRVDTPDLDGDGVIDLVTFSALNQHLTTLYGAGDGPRIRRDVPLDTWPRSMVSGDFDADGTIDLAVALQATQLDLFLGTPDSALRKGPSLEFYAPLLCVADMDADGDLDLVASTTRDLSILLNDGSGSSWARHDRSTGRMSAMAAGDVDGDHDVDLILASGNLSLLLAETPGVFVDGGSRPGRASGNLNYTALRIADLDGDGSGDVVGTPPKIDYTSEGDYEGYYRRAAVVDVWQGDEGILDRLSTYLVGGEITDIILADLDADGDLDVASANPYRRAVAVNYNLTHPMSHAPRASTLSPLRGVAGDAVSLRDHGSADPAGAPLSYKWRQVGGAPVVLSDVTLPEPTFTAPVPTEARVETLRFELTVSSGNRQSQPDSTTVFIRPLEFDVANTPRHTTWTRVLSARSAITKLLVDLDTPSRVFAGTAAEDILLSTDRGTAWQQVFEGAQGASVGILGIVIAPWNPDALLAAVGRGLHHSADGGLTWQPWHYSNPVTDLDVGSGGIFASGTECNGLLWIDALSQWPWRIWPFSSDDSCTGAVLSFEIDPRDPDVRYLLADDGWGILLFRATDGITWEQYGPSFARQLRGLRVSPHTGWVYAWWTIWGQRNGRIPMARSRRLGTAWEDAATGLPDSTLVHDLIADPEETLTLYLGADQGMFVSRDGGSTWQRLPGAPESLNVTALSISPGEPRLLYAGTQAGDIYRVALTRGTDTWVAEVGGEAPTGFGLHPCYPNPFNATTTIPFDLPAPSTVTLTIYDLAGQRVTTLARTRLPAGPHHVLWDGSDAAQRPLASGTYICRMTAGGWTATRKLMLLR